MTPDTVNVSFLQSLSVLRYLYAEGDESVTGGRGGSGILKRRREGWTGGRGESALCAEIMSFI